MIITTQSYLKQLVAASKVNDEFQEKLKTFITSQVVDLSVVKELYQADLLDCPVADFYLFMNKKLSKVTKELLSNDSKNACDCIKTITSLITQATITLEKQFDAESLESANEFIECVGLKSLSNSLFQYFDKGDIYPIQQEILRAKEDLTFVLNNLK